jgi:hypothetical protein
MTVPYCAGNPDGRAKKYFAILEKLEGEFFVTKIRHFCRKPEHKRQLGVQ